MGFCASGLERVSRLLSLSSVTIESVRASWGQVLHEAARCGQDACVVMLLDEYGASVGSRSLFARETALHLAAEGSHRHTAFLLLQRGFFGEPASQQNRGVRMRIQGARRVRERGSRLSVYGALLESVRRERVSGEPYCRHGRRVEHVRNSLSRSYSIPESERA